MTAKHVNNLIRALLGVVLFTLANYATFADAPETNEIKSQVQEGLSLSGGVVAAVNEFFQEHERFPKDNAEAGLVEPNEIRGQYVNSVSVGSGNGVVSIEYGNYAAPVISGSTLQLVPHIQSPRPIWKCASDYISEDLWPAKCQI